MGGGRFRFYGPGASDSSATASGSVGGRRARREWQVELALSRPGLGLPGPTATPLSELHTSESGSGKLISSLPVQYRGGGNKEFQYNRHALVGGWGAKISVADPSRDTGMNPFTT